MTRVFSANSGQLGGKHDADSSSSFVGSAVVVNAITVASAVGWIVGNDVAAVVVVIFGKVAGIDAAAIVDAGRVETVSL